MLEATFRSFRDMKTKAKLKQKQPQQEAAATPVVLLYLYEFYNVTAYTQLASSGVKSIIARVMNALVEGLNSRPRLARYIVLMLDKDLIDEANVFHPEAAVIKTFDETLTELVRQVNLVIRRRREDLSLKNPGAVFGEDPKVIHVKMIRRAEFYSINCRLGKICSVRTKFNEVLNDVAARHEHYIMNVNVCDRRDHFDLCGNLSEKGKKILWGELDHLMERFDRNDIQLLPSVSRIPPNMHHKANKEDRN